MSAGRRAEGPYRYAAFGASIQSDFALPQLCAARGDAAPDLLIRARPVAAGDVIAPALRRRGVRGLFRYECRAGATVDVDLVPGADAMDVADMIAGWVLAIVAYQRALLPLHAAAVCAGAGLVALAGPSGAGKSTLAAALAARGLPLAADDMVAVKPGSPAMASGGAARLKLSPQSLAAVGWPAADWPLSNTVEGKRLVAAGAAAPDAAAWRPLVAVFHVVRGGADAVRRLSPIEAASAARQLIRSPQLMSACGDEAAHWGRWLALCARTPIYALAAPDDLGELPRLADRVVAALERPPALAPA
jgi:hypothetical protein